MIRTISGIAMALALLAVAGCSTVTEGEYKSAQVVLKESGTTRRQITADCIADMKRESAADKANMAAFLGVSVARLPAAFCNRIVGAMADGRLSHRDIFGAQRNGNYAKLITVLRG
ncbi:hypothetical protein [Mesorhizobium retamae]|uniref:Lipoprotein n=1 Tax=Mesorhizobium retamae TaxID=2912854 RepID=A0ABS9QAL8_9HYPH|nr:hypothetical protein [Mesorhizobium sp. IRAMC:0171]MCG7504454.1 hypothetical protein [Mesorhizobium sp. IRAMC:0171]